MAQPDQVGQSRMRAPIMGTSYIHPGDKLPAQRSMPAPFAKRWTYQELKATDGIVPLQSGTNRFASQKGDRHFGTPRDVNGTHLHRIWDDPQLQAANGDELLRTSEQIIRAQAGSNQFASQRGSTGFGAPRDVVGKERHGRFWQFGLEGEGEGGQVPFPDPVKSPVKCEVSKVV